MKAAQGLFTARISDDGMPRVIHVAGDLDIASRAKLRTICLQGDRGSVVVDIGELTFMDCAGYGALMAVRSVLTQRGESLSPTNASGEPAMLLRLLDRLQGRTIVRP
ncbi:MAG: STAS domain-containing protein [Ilumatobacteraceae bacterium]